MTYQQKWLYKKYKKVNIAIQLGKKHFEIDLHLLIPPKNLASWQTWQRIIILYISLSNF